MSNNTFRHTYQLPAFRFARRFIALALPALLLITCFAAFVERGLAQDRALTVKETSWPKGVLELVEVKNLQAPDFPKGFGLVIRNISNKPIYHIWVHLQFPGTEQYSPRGLSGIVSVHFGPTRLMPADSRPEAWDVPLQPGETCTLGIEDERAAKFFHWLDSASKRQLLEHGLRQIVVNAQKINFGDGTGYLAGSYYPVTRSTNK